jgi:hypothetical protein
LPSITTKPEEMKVPPRGLRGGRWKENKKEGLSKKD